VDPDAGCAAAILAGGQASRMGGRAKSLLTVGGERIIDRQLRALRPLFAEIFIVGGDPSAFAQLGLPVHVDCVAPGAGPLRGILTALRVAKADRVLCLACDMPYLDPRALRLVRDTLAVQPIVVPVVGGRPEPLHARYDRAVAPIIERQLLEGDLRAASLLERCETYSIDEAELSEIDRTLRFLANVNTPDELASSS
jgi:molybdopterin-guanine dinucleotide biosynthesis protein A